MTPIALVVSDVDGTLLTKDKTLTDGARAAVRRLHDAGIGFTITSSRPTIGMRFLIEPLAIALPVGAFNGSCIVDPQLKVIEQHLIPASAAQRSLDVLNEFGVDIWLFTSELWLTRHGDGEYVPHEIRAIRADPTLLQRCEAAMQRALGADATAVRSQNYYLDITPPGCDKCTFVQAIAKRQGISTDAVATIGDMQNDLAMFKNSGVSIAMGNATDDVKKLATHVTTSNENEGFAGAVDIILRSNQPIG